MESGHGSKRVHEVNWWFWKFIDSVQSQGFNNRPAMGVVVQPLYPLGFYQQQIKNSEIVLKKIELLQKRK